jgi:hypothetical protein
MIKKLLGAAAMAAVVFAVAPASAAKMAAMGCSGPNLAKTETMVEVMADGDAKWDSYKEMTAAQTAMLDGRMGQCAMHLSKAAHDAGMTK